MIKTKQNLKDKNVRPSRKAERQTENKSSLAQAKKPTKPDMDGMVGDPLGT